LADVVDTNNDAAAKVVTDKAGISPIRPASLLLNKEGVVKHENIKKAIAEAQEFIKRGRAVMEDNKQYDTYGISSSALSGALRRQSMELTRALADMRKP